MIFKNISKYTVVLPLGEYTRIDPGETVDVKTKDDIARLKGFVNLSSAVLEIVKTNSSISKKASADSIVDKNDDKGVTDAVT